MVNIDLNQLVRQNIKDLRAYHVEEIPDGIKLHANENPYPPDPELLKRFQESLKDFASNRYPDPDCRDLKKAISKRIGVPQDHLVIGNGSDELIMLLMQVFCNPGDAIAFPDPSFSMYSIIAQGLGLCPAPLPLNERWDFKAGDFLQAAKQADAKILFLSYPNNPTGNCFSETEIRQVMENYSGILVLDEAYQDFSGKTFLGDISTHNNLIVLRSLSKIGLAGLRVGYAVGAPEVVRQMNKVRLPYNSNAVSQAFAELLLTNFSLVQQQIDAILKERKRLLQALEKMERVTVFPSDSNFILFRVAENGVSLFQKLMKDGVLIRDLSAHPRLRDCLRVTIGTPEENDAFLSQLSKSIG